MFFVRCQLFKILQPVDRINQSRYNNCKNNYCILVQIKKWAQRIYGAVVWKEICNRWVLGKGDRENL